MGRLWCSLYISGHKTEKLVTTGPYSITRNPLYFFSLIGAFGVGLASETLVIPAVVLLGFAIYYPRVIKAEEKRLLKIHAEQFDNYVARTPRFFPKWSLLIEPKNYVVHPARFRKDILSALWFIWLIGVLEIIEGIHEAGIVVPIFTLY